MIKSRIRMLYFKQTRPEESVLYPLVENSFLEGGF